MTDPRRSVRADTNTKLLYSYTYRNYLTEPAGLKFGTRNFKYFTVLCFQAIFDFRFSLVPDSNKFGSAINPFLRISPCKLLLSIFKTKISDILPQYCRFQPLPRLVTSENKTKHHTFEHCVTEGKHPVAVQSSKIVNVALHNH